MLARVNVSAEREDVPMFAKKSENLAGIGHCVTKCRLAVDR